jgi:hypothetical protein
MGDSLLLTVSKATSILQTGKENSGFKKKSGAANVAAPDKYGLRSYPLPGS